MDFYKENGKKLERSGKMIDRVGFEAFQSAILGG
jgi:dissimilatory sulfite reductase (desulfoviridin) alpha/beta subunit